MLMLRLLRAVGSLQGFAGMNLTLGENPACWFNPQAHPAALVTRHVEYGDLRVCNDRSGKKAVLACSC